MQDHHTPHPSTIPYGYCHCGCGGKTNISSQTQSKFGWVKGEPRRYKFNHHKKTLRNNIEWSEEMGCYLIHLYSKTHPGHIAMVDAQDIDSVSRMRWNPKQATTTWYACAGGKTLHRLIIGAEDDEYVDHINHNGLDNRRHNLRLVSQAENSLNRGVYSNNTSGFKGVSKRKSSWSAYIQYNNVRITIGAFTNRIAAANAYDHAAIAIHGDYCSTNLSLGLLAPDQVMIEEDVDRFLTPYSRRSRQGIREIIVSVQTQIDKEAT